MMDHERQEGDLQEVFEATQASYWAAIENTFAPHGQHHPEFEEAQEAPEVNR